MATTGIPASEACLTRRHDAIHVNCDDDQAINLLLDVVFDGAVLCGRFIVGVEDDKLVTGGIGRLLRAFVDLVERKGLAD